MSTLRVSNLQNEASANNQITLGTDGFAQINGVAMPNAGSLSNRNLIINGAMQVAQRGTQETGVTTTGYYTCDRWRLPISSLGTWTVQQSTDAPDGFINSFRLLCTTAEASPAAGDIVSVQQRIEAQDLQHIFTDKSAGDTSALTLSFWVKASRSGDASFSVIQVDNSSRQFNASYNIGAADTWEHKTISIPADDSAVINNDNGVGLQVMWHLHSGSNFTGGTQSPNWEASNAANQNVNNLGIGQAVDDDFLITGVQLEVGSVATPFEHRSYGDELLRCQRYFATNYRTGSAIGSDWSSPYTYGFGGDMAGGAGRVRVQFPVSMRATPTMTYYGSDGTTGQIRRGSTNITASADGGSNHCVQVSGGTGNAEYNVIYSANAEL